MRRRFGARVRDRFEARRFEVAVTSDSDGDDRIELVGLSGDSPPSGAAPGGANRPKTRHTFVSALHDPTVPRMLGAWMARSAGVPLVDRATPEAREAELDALVDQLERTGRFGRVAVSLVRKARKRQCSRLRRESTPPT